jgi:hypothetical protein
MVTDLVDAAQAYRQGKSRYVLVDFSDGTRWRVNVGALADQWGLYQARQATGEEDYSASDAWQQAYYKAFMEALDSDELVEWARNNVVWSEIKWDAKQVPTETPSADYAQEWANAPMTLVREKPVTKESNDGRD